MAYLPVNVAFARRAMVSAALVGMLAMGVPAGAVQTWLGSQLTEDFEGLPLNQATINFVIGEDLYSVLAGGSVAEGSAAFPAASGTQLYVGSNVVFDVPDKVNYGWWGIAANLTATAPLQVRSFIYDSQAEGFMKPGTVFHIEPGTGFRFDTGSDAIYLRLEFSSAAPFAIDDLQLGTPDGVVVIPEPGPWAMLICGFGLVGAVRRQKRRAVRAGVA